jgi:hypothetical protein
MPTVHTVAPVSTTNNRHLTADQVARRLQLFLGDGLQAAPTRAAGSRVVLPEHDPHRHRDLQTVLAAADEDERRSLVQAGHALGQALLSADAAQPMGAAVVDAFALAAKASRATAAMNPSDAVNGILQLALGGVEADLRDIALQLDAGVKRSASYREEIAYLNDVLKDWPPDKETQEVTVADADGTERTQTLSRADVENLRDDLVAKKESSAQLTEMMQLDLQHKMQEQQQTITMLSNILKQGHDTLMAMVKNIH